MDKINFELKSGDIFLYHGTHLISKLIRKFDGTEVNHASLYVGNNQVIEAKEGSSGVSKNSIYKSIENSKYIKVFRLKDETLDINPVLNVANNFYLSPNRYGYEQIVLLAFIILINKALPTKTFRWIAKTILERAAQIILKLTQNGKEVLICSELVYRSYEEPYPGILKLNNWNTTKKINNLPKNVHPNSLYAQFSNLDFKKENTQEKLNIDKNTSIETIVKQTEEELKNSIEYLDNKELEKNIPNVDISEVENAFLLFANQVNNQINKNEKSLKNFNTIIADFVTPGNLYNSSALNYIGEIKRV